MGLIINKGDQGTPTPEQNQERFNTVQKNSQKLIDLQTDEYLKDIQQQQVGNFDLAGDSDVNQYVSNRRIGVLADRPNLNQDTENMPESFSGQDIDRSWVNQFGESFIKGVGETVIGSTGDVINMITAPLPDFSLAEGNVLGRALREWGDDIGNEHTTYLRKKLEGQELSWGSLADPDFWSTNVAEMIPMALEFMATGFGAGALGKKGAGILVKSLGTEARLARATLSVADKAKQLGTGVKVLEDVAGTGKGLSKYLFRNAEGTLKMSKGLEDFVGTFSAGLSNNLLTGATNAMDYHRTMQAENQADIAAGRPPRYSEKEMSEVAANSMKINLAWAPIDMISWGISYAGLPNKAMKALMPKVSLKAADQVAREAAEMTRGAIVPILKGVARAAGHGTLEGIEETYQETYEEWASIKAKEKVTGEKAPDFMDFYNSKANLNTKVASFAMGALMGGAMNFKINKTAEEGVDYMNRQETLRAAFDANDKGGHSAKTWHIRNTMVDLLSADKVEAFDGFLSHLASNGNITEEEVADFQQEFEDVQQDWNEAESLNIQGKFALFDNTVKAKGIERIIENKKALLEENKKILEKQLGPDTRAEYQQAVAELQALKDKATELGIDADNSSLVVGEGFVMTDQASFDSNRSDASALIPKIQQAKEKVKSLNNPEVFQQYEKLEAIHQEQMISLGANLAQANANRQNLIAGKKANPLKIKFWRNGNGNEMAVVDENAGSTVAIYDPNNPNAIKQSQDKGEQVGDPNAEGMTEEELASFQQEGAITGGLSNKQYKEFVEMTDDELFERARQANLAFIKSLPKNAKDLYEKFAESELVSKVKDKFKKGEGKEEAKTEEETVESVEPETMSDEELDNNEYVQYLLNAMPDGEKKTKLAERYKQRKAEVEAKFLAENLQETQEDQEEAPSYQIVKDKVSGRYKYVDIKTGEDHPSGQTFATRATAKKANLGNASMVGDVLSIAGKGIVGGTKLGFKGVKAGVKAPGKIYRFLKGKGKEAIDTATEETRNLNNMMAQVNANKRNKTQDQMRRAIMEEAYYSAPVRANAANPMLPVSKNALDAYLDTTIAKFKYGPRVIDEVYTVNRMLKAKGIDVDVVAVDNMITTTGLEALGYNIANTIFIDEKTWNQPEIFMHEMLHIHYRYSKNAPATKAVVQFALEDEELVRKIRNNYIAKVKMRDVNDGTIYTIEELDNLIGDGKSTKSDNKSVEKALADFKEFGFEMLPMEEQEVLQEELFTHTLQGPMAKNFNHVLEPIRERRRIKKSKSYWAYLKGTDVTFEDYALDVVNKLARGKNVAQGDLQEHISKNLERVLADSSKYAFTASGFASLVDQEFKDRQAYLDAVAEEKAKQRAEHNPAKRPSRSIDDVYKRAAKKITDEVNMTMAQYSELEKRNEIEHQLEELEMKILEDGAYDDYEGSREVSFKGATRILNSFTRSLNYVRRKKFANSGTASTFDESMLLDRDLLLSEIFNLAFEHKGNTNAFIESIEKSDIEEIYQFSVYMDKMHGDEKYKILSSMAYVMSNQQTISSVKSVVNSQGKWESVNALSQTEMNKVQNHLQRMAQWSQEHYNFNGSTNASENVMKFDAFKQSYANIKAKNQTNQDYLNMLRVLTPYGVNYPALIENKTINMKGHNVNIKTLIDKLVKSKIMEQVTKSGEIGLNVYNAKDFVSAIVDSNRKYTSYSVVQNAEGNMEPSKITNNHILSELNDMNDFLVRDKAGRFPTFKSFKKRYAHLSDPNSDRIGDNPVLRGIYENAKNGISRPSVSQYLGLSHKQHGTDVLYKNSNDFTQTIEEFMMFSGEERANNYMQTMSAFADSPRKFMMSVARIKYDEFFKPDGTMTTKGNKLLENAWKIYDKSNQNLPAEKKAETIQNYSDFKTEFVKGLNEEVRVFNENAKNLIENKTIPSKYFEKGKLNAEGKKKVREFAINQVINGFGLAEVFNPGIPFNDIVKRNKGNGSPVMTFRNKKCKMEAIPINDESVEGATNSGMYMTQKMAQKIVDAGLGVFDLNHGLKLLNYHVERDNPNFKGVSAYFKGYTTIISEETLVTEPALRPIYELLTDREENYNAWHIDTFGKEPSLDVTDGTENYINFAVPYSAIKSDFLSEEQKESLKDLTYENLATADFVTKEKINTALDNLYYAPNEKAEPGKRQDKFIGLSTNNFGPQQIMDKYSEESTTPVQFLSSVIVNGMVGDNLKMGEEIQKLIRQDMNKNLDEILNELGNMNPKKYKEFILKNLDLNNMDQKQRMMIQESMTNLNHPAIAEFVTNTLANRLKQAGNRLKTKGTIAQQKPSLFYRHRNGITVNGSNTLSPRKNRHNADGSIGTQIMEIVLPKHMKDSGIKFRTYLKIDDPQVQRIIGGRTDLQAATSKAKITGDYSEVLKEVALTIARVRHGKARPQGSYGHDLNDYVGEYKDADGNVGWFVRGDNVIATRIPSHGPASTGVFEAMDYMEGEGNQVIVHEDFTTTAGADYDGDSLFIQRKDKSTPAFNEALDKTVDLWTAPSMREQVKANIEFEKTVKKVISKNEKVKKPMPMSPSYHRHAYNNTMISKRNIGIIFNTHRIANYLASYNVELATRISIDDTKVDRFQDGEVGEKSRNNNSAMLANIILDNSKWGFADSLGLNDQTINQYSLLTNLGFSLQQLNDIMNSKAVKAWNKHHANNDNPYFSKMKNKDIKAAIYAELGITIEKNKKKSDVIAISTDKMIIDSLENMKSIIDLMENLSTVNADILHVSKIMAGHKGITNNPFLLEQQINNFEKVVNSESENALLKFPEGFKNNPDIKGYHDTAKKVLEVLKKANNVYNTSSAELMDKLNQTIGYDGQMSSKQTEAVTALIKKFNTSRILGLNNISSAQKSKMKQQFFKGINNYIDALSNTVIDEKTGLTALDKSVLFNRALNINIKEKAGQKHLTPARRVIDDSSYVSANPRFFSESLTEEDNKAVQEEFAALPQELKDGFIMADLIDRGFSGKLSLSAVFDEQTNHDISTYAAVDSREKNNPIDKKIMEKVENLIVSNEFNTNENILDATSKEKMKPGENLLEYIGKHNPSLRNALNIGNPMIFKVDGQPYIFNGVTKKEKANIRARNKGAVSLGQQEIQALEYTRINPFKKFDGDINLELLSLADNNGRPVYRARKSTYNKNTEYMAGVEPKTVKKKVNTKLGNAYKIDFHNYNDVAPLTQREFNVAMEYDNTISDQQKELVYKQYLLEKKEANDLTSEFNPTTFHEMNDKELIDTYVRFAPKDAYAYSVITTPLLLELNNRNSIEQSQITKMFEDGKDISLMDSYLNNNNISSNHPSTQGLIRKLNAEYKSFVKERGVYIKEINKVTEELYNDKFKLSSNKFVRTAQRIYQSLFKNRKELYEKLYGKLLNTETYKDKNGEEKTELKFKDDAEIKRMFSAGEISQAEFNFYKTFVGITHHLKQFDSNSKTRTGYIPHTAMNSFEMYANRGLLGLFVNSKGLDSVVEDVKVYTDFEGDKKLMSFSDVKNYYNALAVAKKQSPKDILAFEKLKRKAIKLQKTGKNEDGSNIVYSNMQNMTLLGMGPMSRFESSRSAKAELMPSMDLNKALNDYVHASMFTNGNETFKGFKSLIPHIDAVMAYNDKNGYKNAYNYVKEVIKEGFIMNKDQILFGKKTDSFINGLIKGNTFYALGFKGLIAGKGIYAIGNLAIGKYMNIKREGGKSWAKGEARYWGIDKGISLDTLSRRKRAKNIIKNLGFIEADFYDDVSVEKRTGLDSVFGDLALMPMSVTEDWIQKSHMLGMLTDEEFDKFDEQGNYKVGETQISEERIRAMDERIKNTHGKGYTPTDQSRIHKVALGKLFMQFSRHLPSQIRERFAKEDVDMNGNKYVGSLRQVGKSAIDIFNNGMTPSKFKEYYSTLQKHEQEALMSALRGAGMMMLLGFVASGSESDSEMSSKLSSESVAGGVMSDANIHFDPERLSMKGIPPAIRSVLSVTKGITGSNN